MCGVAHSIAVAAKMQKETNSQSTTNTIHQHHHQNDSSVLLTTMRALSGDDHYWIAILCSRLSDLHPIQSFLSTLDMNRTVKHSFASWMLWAARNKARANQFPGSGEQSPGKNRTSPSMMPNNVKNDTTQNVNQRELRQLVSHLYEEPPHALCGSASPLKPQTKPKLLSGAPKNQCRWYMKDWGLC